MSAAAFGGDGKFLLTSSEDSTARLWDLTVAPGPPGEGAALTTAAVDVERFATSSWEAATGDLVARAESDVSRCLTTAQRMRSFLRIEPPPWCVEREKYPYNTQGWRNWLAGKGDGELASEFGAKADSALRDEDDFSIALQLAELGLKFGPEADWIKINRAHARMFLGDVESARAEYLKHRDKPAEGRWWKEGVLEDFEKFRASGRDHPLMKEIEEEFTKSSSSP